MASTVSVAVKLSPGPTATIWFVCVLREIQGAEGRSGLLSSTHLVATHGDVGHYGRASGAIDYGAPSDQEIASFFHATRGGAGWWALAGQSALSAGGLKLGKGDGRRSRLAPLLAPR